MDLTNQRYCHSASQIRRRIHRLIEIEFIQLSLFFLMIFPPTIDRIRPVCLPTSAYAQSLSFVGKMPVVVGWGRTDEFATMTNTLQQVKVPVITNDECKEQYAEAKRLQAGAKFRFNESYVICAGAEDGGISPCKGDSGGPLVLPIQENNRSPYHQIGVVSYGQVLRKSSCIHV